MDVDQFLRDCTNLKDWAIDKVVGGRGRRLITVTHFALNEAKHFALDSKLFNTL